MERYSMFLGRKNQYRENDYTTKCKLQIQCDSYQITNGIFHRSDQISRSVVSDSLRPHESQHARPPCPSPTPGVHADSCPSSQWCHPAISSSVIPFSSCPQSLPASESFPMSQLFAWGGWMASLTRWMWVWVNSGSWWWTGRPGVLPFMGSRRIGHDWAAELNWTELIPISSFFSLSLSFFFLLWTYQVFPVGQKPGVEWMWSLALNPRCLSNIFWVFLWNLLNSLCLLQSKQFYSFPCSLLHL